MGSFTLASDFTEVEIGLLGSVSISERSAFLTKPASLTIV